MRADLAAALGVSATRLIIAELNEGATRAMIVVLKSQKAGGTGRDSDAESLVMLCVQQAKDPKSVLRSVIPTLKSAAAVANAGKAASPQKPRDSRLQRDDAVGGAGAGDLEMGLIVQFCKVPATDFFLREFTMSGDVEKPTSVVKAYEAIHAVKRDAAGAQGAAASRTSQVAGDKEAIITMLRNEIAALKLERTAMQSDLDQVRSL